MKRMPSALHGKEGAITAAAAVDSEEKKKERERAEPRSVLDHHRSPSPSTSGDVAAVSDPSKWPPSAKEEWELQPLDSTVSNHKPSMDDDWDSMLSDHSSPFLRWITSDPQNPQTHYVQQQQQQQQQHMLSLPIPDLDPSLLLEGVSDSIPLDPLFIPSTSSFPFPQPPTMFYPEPNLLLPFPQQQHHQQQQIFLPTSQFQGQGLPAKAKASAAATDESSAAVEQLVKAAEQLEAGNLVNAHGILARLNQLSPHHGKPLLRSAFYFKEALGAVVLARDVPQPPGTPWDVVLKLSAHKSFSEASPIPQFTHFTCVQALLEELTSCERIHIIDFDVGVGGQWSSFLQELSQRRPSSPSLKITAFVSPASHQQLELMLVRDNLTQFAGELGIPFEFNAHNVDSFELAVLSLSSGGDDAIAVNLPAGSCCGASGSQLLRLVKQLSPKIVVSTAYGGDRSELPFSQYLLHSLRSYSVLIESIDAANANLDVSTKIGKFLLQPRIEKSVYGRYRGGDKMLPWRALFASAGFVPLQFSNFTETQAECLLKRTPARGFHVEKRQSSLVLFWQHEELVSVSAWRC